MIDKKIIAGLAVLVMSGVVGGIHLYAEGRFQDGKIAALKELKKDMYVQRANRIIDSRFD